MDVVCSSLLSIVRAPRVPVLPLSPSHSRAAVHLERYFVRIIRNRPVFVVIRQYREAINTIDIQETHVRKSRSTLAEKHLAW